jgi:hypothetical protein
VCLAIVCLAIVCLAACAGPSTGRFPGTPSPEPGQVPVGQSLEAIPWTADRPLRWTDFRGRPDDDLDVAAVTSYALSWESNCTPDGFTFRVTSVFLPDQSWVQPDVLDRESSSQVTLAHEQAHFDLSEIQARKMRRALSRMVRPCRLTEEELTAALRPIVVEDATRQARYDRETSHGLDRPQQVRWEAEVGRELESLERYADSGAPGIAASDRVRADRIGGGPR